MWKTVNEKFEALQNFKAAFHRFLLDPFLNTLTQIILFF